MPFSANESGRTSGINPQRFAFDQFELDLRSRELRNDGRKIRLQAQPFRLLTLLVENAGQVVTRDEVCRALWPANTFVDFDHSVASAVNKIREALGDSSENPRFVETLPKLGYRFIAEIRREQPPVAEAPAVTPERVDDSVAVPRPRSGHQPWLRTLTWVLLGVAVILAARFAWSKSRPHPHANNENLTAAPFTAYPGIEIAPSLSPDGTRIAFAWDRGEAAGFDLYVKAIGSETLLRLTNHPSQWISSTWSPDGTQIAFHRMAGADSGIYVVPALGGLERKLRSTRIPYEVVAPISWSPDGKWIGFGEPLPDKAEDRTFLLSVDTLETRALPHNPLCLHEAMPTFSHSGTELAYLCVRNTNAFDLYITTEQGSSPRRVASCSNFPRGLAWSEDDQRLILGEWTERGSQLNEFTIADGTVRQLSFSPSAAWPGVSSTGHKLAYTALSGYTNIWRKDLLHHAAPPIRLSSSTRPQNDAQYSPDGKHIAFVSSRTGVPNIWISDPDGENLAQLSNLETNAGTPRWSPDSTKIAFDSHPGDHYDIYVVDVAERVPRKLQTNVRDVARPSWSRDGKWIYFRSFESIGHKISRCPASGGDATAIAESRDGTFPQESFDGTALYFADRNAFTALTKISLNDGFAASAVEGLPVVSDEYLWTVARGGIYFVAAAEPTTVKYYDFATRNILDIFKSDKEFDEGLSVSPDGRYVLYSQVEEKTADIMLVDHFY